MPTLKEEWQFYRTCEALEMWKTFATPFWMSTQGWSHAHPSARTACGTGRGGRRRREEPGDLAGTPERRSDSWPKHLDQRGWHGADRFQTVQRDLMGQQIQPWVNRDHHFPFHRLCKLNRAFREIAISTWLNGITGMNRSRSVHYNIIQVQTDAINLTSYQVKYRFFLHTHKRGFHRNWIFQWLQP